MTFDTQRLYELLPAIHRIRDSEDAEPLRALIDVIAEQAVILEDSLAQLYDDAFVETAAPWVVPYIADLVGLGGALGAGPLSSRAEVANTIGYRRRKGTAAMLEQLARDVTGWPARAVEFFQLLATTQNLNHVRPENRAFLDLRDSRLAPAEAHGQPRPERLIDRPVPEPRLSRLNGPFEHLTGRRDIAHTVDVRRIEKRGSGYNLPNAGIALWRLRAHALTQSPARPADPAGSGRFFFDPLGRDIALFHRAVTEERVTTLAEPVNVAEPISRRTLAAALPAYYGAGQSLCLYRPVPNGRPQIVAETEIVVADLSDWERVRRIDKIAVDPELGRILTPAGDDSAVLVSYHHGFSANLGGGEYDRIRSFGLEPGQSLKVPSVTHPLDGFEIRLETLQDALAAAQPGSVRIEVVDNARYEAPSSIDATGLHLELRASDKRRSTITAPAPLELTLNGGPNDAVILNGFWFDGVRLRVPAGLGRLSLLHCTLPPGAEPSLSVEGETEVHIERSIVGALRIGPDARATIIDSIVDALDETAQAYGGATAGTAGGVLTIEKSTLLGRVHAEALELASNTIFVSPVTVTRRQEGCVRFSFVAPGSRTPVRYLCQPLDDAVAAMGPDFTSTRHGDAGYFQLSRRCPDEIYRGGEDGSEMGVYWHLHQPRRESYLRARLEEYLRFGLEAGYFFAT